MTEITWDIFGLINVTLNCVLFYLLWNITRRT